MDFLIPAAQLLAGLLGILLLYNLYAQKQRSRSKVCAPRAPGAWPIIGHLHQFKPDNPPLCQKLGRIADKLGPVFMVQLGMKSMLVVNSWEAAKECFTTSDAALCSRPALATSKYLGYNSSMFAVTPHGPLWRQLKKLAKFEIFSARKREMVKHLRVSEIDFICKDMHRVWSEQGNTAPTKLDMGEIFLRLAMNVMTNTLAGRRLFSSVSDLDDEARHFRRLLREFTDAVGIKVVSDVFPNSFLEWLDPSGNIRMMKRLAKEYDLIIEKWVDEHRKRRLVDGPGSDRDYTDFLLSAVENGAVPSEYDNETNLKATLAVVFLGGANTIPLCLTWTLTLLLNNEHVLKRAKEELDQKVGGDKWVQESDIKSLVYLQAIVYEAMRLYPPGPVGIAHEAIEDCYVSGYHVPKGTRILFNVWKVQRDPRVFIEPTKFMPERWLTSEETFDASKYRYEFITFSLGRRACPGEAMAMRVAHLITARLLQGFNLSRPMDMPIDVSEMHTLLLRKALPLEVTITPRLHPKLYQEI